MRKNSKRPILWIGDEGLPQGVLGREFSSLKHPVIWESSAHEAVSKIAGVQPILVIVESASLTSEGSVFLASLEEARQSLNFVLFVLSEDGGIREYDQVDGVIVKGRDMVPQIRAVLSTVKAMNRLESEVNELRRETRISRGEIDRLRSLVVRDDLTRLFNLRFFNRSLDTEHARAGRFGRRYSLIFVDLDGLKEVNARHGHLVGAEVLRRVGDLLNERLRRIDIAARVGGDEFVIICPETTKLAAHELAESLRREIDALGLKGGCGGHGITASMGVASFPEDGDQPGQILGRADRALYEAKARGKNNVCCWGDFSSSEESEEGGASVYRKTLEEPLEEDGEQVLGAETPIT